MIAQADSRKWMACLYNSFLFMEAKIMKMAKKLLAVVLTGVMAVSMLTGCAMGDKLAEKALVKMLNKSVATSTDFKGYEQNDKMDSAANKVLKDEKTGKSGEQLQNALTALAGKNNSLNAVAAGYTTNGKKYAFSYIVVKVPSGKTGTANWGEAVNGLLSVDGFKTPAYKKDSNKKAQIGISDSFEATVGGKKNDYVVVTIQTALEVDA